MSRNHTALVALVWIAVFAVVSPVVAGEPVAVANHERRVTAIAFSPDGKWLASADADGQVAITNLAKKKRDFTLRQSVKKNGEESNTSVYSLAISPDGMVLATGFTDWVAQGGLERPVGAVRLWDVATRREIATVRGDVLTNPVTALAFSRDGKHFAAGGPSPGMVRIAPKGEDPELGELRIWERDTLKLKFSARSRVGHAYTAAFSPDGKLIAFGCGDGSYRDGDPAERRGELAFWDVEKGTEAGTLKWRGAGVFATAFPPKGTVMAVGGGVPPLGMVPRREPVGRLVLWDYAAQKEIAQLKGHRYLVSAVAFSPDGTLLAAGGGDTNEKDDAVELKVWDVTAKREVADLSATLKPMVTSIAFSPDGKTLAAASDKTVFLWDVAELSKQKPRK